MGFRDALIAAIKQARDEGKLTAVQAISLRARAISPAFCARCEELAITEGIASGAIPFASNPAGIDWSGLKDFIVAIMPLIMELIKLFA